MTPVRLGLVRGGLAATLKEGYWTVAGTGRQSLGTGLRAQGLCLTRTAAIRVPRGADAR